MTETAQLDDATKYWIFGGIPGLVVIMTSFSFWLGWEIVKIKTILRFISKKAADVLHDDDDKLKLDQMIESFKSGKMDKNGEKKFLEMLHEVQADKNLDKASRMLALLASISPLLSSNKIPKR